MTTRVSGFEIPIGGMTINGPISDPAVTQYYDQYVKEIRVSLDVDRVPYATARFVFQDLPEQFWQNLEPRRAPYTQVAFRLEHWDLDADAVASRLPASSLLTAATSSTFANLIVVSADRDIISGECVVETVGQDYQFLERGRPIPGTIDHGQPNVRDLAGWIVTQHGPGPYTIPDYMSAATTLIPAGERRQVHPGDLDWDLLEPEASAIGGRLFADLAGQFCLALTADPPRVKPYTPPVISAHDPDAGGPPLTALRERVERDGDWADIVLVEYDWRDASDVDHVEYWWYEPPGGSSKLQKFQFDRPKPGGNQAQEIRNKSLQRGRFVQATCRADFRYVPGYDLVVNLAPGTADVNYGMIRRVEYSIRGTGEAVMDLTAQTGQPLA